MDDAGSRLLEQPPILSFSTDRLELRTVTMDDLDDIMSFITRQDIMRWTSQAAVTNKAQGEKWLSARALGPNVFNFAVREKSPNGVENRVIGMFGTFHWPSIGYMLHPDFAGKGYATEGLRALIPRIFARIPPPSENGTGHDFLDGFVDTENYASQRVLEKLGFTRGEVMYGEIENSMGLRDTIVYRLPRPGKRLEDLGVGFGKEDEEEKPEPPVQ